MVAATSTYRSSGPASILLRIVWMGSLPVVFLCVLFVADGEGWALGRVDLILLIAVVAALAARAIDAIWLGGTTADGRPAKRSHVRGYSIRLLAFAGIGWAVGHAIAQ